MQSQVDTSVDDEAPPEVGDGVLQGKLCDDELVGEGWAAEVAGVDEVRADLLKDQLQFDPRVSWRERGIATALGHIAGESGRVENGGRGVEGGG